tara:strand:+ start:536 stop:1780 length:1245 start_codon:yes stop_codon:yes gene_type:complete
MRLPWFYGWTVVVAAFFALTLAYSLHFSFGLFAPHLESALAVDRATIAAPFSVYIAVYSVMSYITGPMTDRIGPRWVVATGGILLAIAYAWLSRAETLWELYLALALFAGLGMSAAFIPLSATVVKWFVRRRGVAVAIAGSGTSAAHVVGPLVVAILIPWLGWRDGMLTLGLLAGGFIMLCASRLLRDPAVLGLRPDGDPVFLQQTVEQSPEEVSWTLREARATGAFWLILAAFFCTWIPIFFPAAHLPAMLLDQGQTMEAAASMIGVMGIGALFGRWVIGWMADRFGGRVSLCVCFGMHVVGYAMFIAVDSFYAQQGASFALGLGVGSSVTMFPVIIGMTFGRTHVGAISGFIFSISGTAAAVGPYAAGLLHAAYGSYINAFAVSAILNVFALAFVAFLKRPARPSTMPVNQP